MTLPRPTAVLAANLGMSERPPEKAASLIRRASRPLPSNHPNRADEQEWQDEAGT